MKKQTTNGLRNMTTIMLLAITALSSQLGNARMPADFSFSAVNTFEDRKNAFRITGIEKGSGELATLTLYNFAGATGVSHGFVRFSGGTPNLLTSLPRHQRCYDYLMRMMDEPGKFFITLHLEQRDDLNNFSRDSADAIIGCDIERQNPTLPAG